jgi:hypothetical protein
VEAITHKFNHDIVFDPELNLMAYSLRDPVSVGTFPTPDADERKPRGKVKRIEVKSRWVSAGARLSDFSWCMVPKPEKMYVPNGQKISRMSVKYSKLAIKYINIFQCEILYNLHKL